MPPPPSTPAPSKFLLSKRQGRQSQTQQTPTQQQQAQPPRFQATPRFSAPSSSATPRLGGAAAPPAASQRQQPPPFFSAATPSTTAKARSTGGAVDAIRDEDDDDIVESSSPLVRAGSTWVDDDDDDDRDDVAGDDSDEDGDQKLAMPASTARAASRVPRWTESIEIDSGTNTQTTAAAEDTEPRAKRRRISVSSAEDDDGGDLPTPKAEIESSDDDPMAIDEVPDEAPSSPLLRAGGDAAHQGHGQEGVDTQSSASDSADDERDSPSRPLRPLKTGFRRPPRFKAPDLTEATEGVSRALELPEAFSPQRRRGGVRYVPGGLAAQMRDWLMQIKGTTEGEDDAGDGFGTRLVVDEVQAGGAPGMVLVRGRAVSSHEEGERLGRESMLVMLAGEGRVTDVNMRNIVGEGAVVGIAQPVWEVDLEEHRGRRWTVACDWAVL